MTKSSNVPIAKFITVKSLGITSRLTKLAPRTATLTKYVSIENHTYSCSHEIARTVACLTVRVNDDVNVDDDNDDDENDDDDDENDDDE